jgi:hypothetical protein
MSEIRHMGLRETINQKKGPVVGAAGVLLCSALCFIVWENKSPGSARINKAFYTTDDGQTWFTDDSDKIFPFDVNGKQAYRVDVYKTSDGKMFVADIERFSDKAKAKLEELRSEPDPDPRAVAGWTSSGLEVRKPGDTKWYRRNSPQGDEILAVSSPDGTPAESVIP